jgi:hypothetical protein
MGRGRAIEECDRDEYLIVPDFIDSAMLDEARQESGKICRGARGEFDGIGTTPEDEANEDVLRRDLCIHFPHKISPLASAGSLLPWFPPPQGVPMGTTDHRDILLVAGEDP